LREDTLLFPRLLGLVLVEEGGVAKITGTLSFLCSLKQRKRANKEVEGEDEGGRKKTYTCRMEDEKH